MRLIDISTPTLPNLFAMVDEADFDWLNKWRWRAVKRDHTTYAARDIYVSGKRVTLRMHREILGAKQDEIVDHRDGNGLNNSRNNIRIADHFQNARNRSLSKQNKSGFLGVSWDARHSKWVSQLQIKVSGKRRKVLVGFFSNLLEAARRRDEAAIEYHGSFAKLNFQK